MVPRWSSTDRSNSIPGRTGIFERVSVKKVMLKWLKDDILLCPKIGEAGGVKFSNEFALTTCWGFLLNATVKVLEKSAVLIIPRKIMPIFSGLVFNLIKGISISIVLLGV